MVTSCPCAAKPAASARPTAPLPMTPTRVGSMARRLRLCREDRLELGLELALRIGADDLLGDRAVLEEDQRRDREDLVGHRGLLVLVDVELDDLQRIALLAGDLLEHGGDHPAGPA